MSRTTGGTAIDRTALGRETIERMVSVVEPRWSVVNARPSEEGSDYVFFVTVETPDGSREVVLKASSGEVVPPAVARSEPRLLDRLAAETNVPVPDVVGFVDDHPELPTPYFLAERLPGENGAGRFDDLSAAGQERVLAAAGRHVAELHSLRSFDSFGRIGVVDGDLRVVGDRFGPKAEWTDWLLADAEDALDGLAGGRFDDLAAPLREHLRDAIPSLDPIDDGALVHWDYRLGNLLLDPETSRTTGALDWVGLVAGDPVYNLATVEDHNVNWQTQDVVRRRWLRDAFRAAYDARRSRTRPPDFRDRKRLYHLCHRLNAMACLPDWYADAPEAVRDERAAVHRAFVRSHLD